MLHTGGMCPGSMCVAVYWQMCAVPGIGALCLAQPPAVCMKAFPSHVAECARHAKVVPILFMAHALDVGKLFCFYTWHTGLAPWASLRSGLACGSTGASLCGRREQASARGWRGDHPAFCGDCPVSEEDRALHMGENPFLYMAHASARASVSPPGNGHTPCGSYPVRRLPPTPCPLQLAAAACCAESAPGE